jgi:CxxC motif-containing protein
METSTEKKAKTKRKKEPKPLNKDKAKRFTCIVCPACCELETDGVEVNGARCPKGEAFARQEMIAPLRVITTTVRSETSKGVRMIPVKTACPVSLALIPEVMKQVKALRLSEIPVIGTRFTTGSPSESVEWIVTGEMN